MKSFISFTTCQNVRSIKDINDKFDYVDEKPKGEGDSPLVACGQSESYNELQYIYDTKLEKHVRRGAITEQQALSALCSACFDLPNPRAREEFYRHLTRELGVEI